MSSTDRGLYVGRDRSGLTAGDMAMGGPYFSPFLLVAMYITGIRFIVGMEPNERKAKGDRFLSIAMSMMTEELDKPSSIPTIRGFLLY